MILAWLSLCDKVQRLACDPADMTAVPYFFSFIKIQYRSLFRYQLAQVLLEKMPLKQRYMLLV